MNRQCIALLHRAILGVILFPLLVAGPANATGQEDAKALYGIGYLFGEQLRELELTAEETEHVLQGFRDQLLGNEPEADPHRDMDAIRAFLDDRQARRASKTREREQAYIREFIDGGGTLTESGLAYEIIEEGSGDKPQATDTVEVHYEGRLTSGEVFDSSYQRGETATFPLNRVIAGWTEGLQLISPGGRIRLVIPAELGYGERGAPPSIPGGATLVFDVELIDIK
ncbi:MAG: FKBP-type peptidyl-prolyl cis-trans isomerase [Ectothiorhodospiraceae bacterium]|nr:FKBP-type peptidyl-prolyl cis-trans isomerase [Ectothiorhodospiraceae bacterium]